jgi:oligoendopeptidase F
MDAFFGKWKEFERTMGVSYYGNLKEDAVYTKVRKYASSSERALTATGFRRRLRRAHQGHQRQPADAAPLLPAAREDARRHRPALLRHLPAATGEGRDYPIDEGIRIMLESSKPLGPEYVAAMKKGPRAAGWTCIRARASNPARTWRASRRSASLRADELHQRLRLGVHARPRVGPRDALVPREPAQPFPTAAMRSSRAEIASTTNERCLLRLARDREGRRRAPLYLGSALERMRATFFRQAMFAEFEHAAHAIVDKGQP